MMRAKFQVRSVTKMEGGNEQVKMSAVTNGTPEDNTYSKFTPGGSLEITISNPDLCGKINPGDKFYMDFTKAE